MQRIRELRKRDNMSQEALAGQMGVSRSAVAMWEAGRSEPDTDKLIALAALFHVSVDYLLQQDLRDRGASELRGTAATQQEYEDGDQEAADIRLIERARRAMSPVEKDRMMKILKASFEEYFKDEGKQ